MRALPWGARVYVGIIVVSAVAIVLIGPYTGIDLGTLVLIAVLFVVAESISTHVVVDVKEAGISPSSAVALAAVVLVGPVGAAVVGFSSCLAVRRQGPVKRAFNGAQFALAAYTAGHVYLLLGGTVGVPGQSDFPGIVLPYVAAVLTHTLLNSVLIGVLMWCLDVTRPTGPGPVRWRPLIVLEVASVGYQMLGLAIAAIWGAVGIIAPLLVLIPLFIARWVFGQQTAEARAHEATLATLCQAVETKDYYTRGHCMRVAEGSAMIAAELGMPAERVQKIRYAGMLHDIGKLGVPTKVLQKNGKLTDDEYAAIKLHPTRGYEIVREISFLDEALAGIRHHHERLDGRGYPMGLLGMEIPESARIISVADVFDCLTSTRSYRRAWSVEAAIAELRRCAGSQFDPRMVEALVRAVSREGWQTPDIAEPPGGRYCATEDPEPDGPSAPVPAPSDPERTVPVAESTSAGAVTGGQDR
ncbi:metal-dependent phosphohydrolase [Nocardiopsis terrae]|uniref:Nucleotidyltransferase with HDIG domain n=1 Tax=Nocardiopsis terrae TaxID=372655 RepID=A0ABR9HCA1_9ACTN|nr:putative nucleotidyltransferase with HDIG domain [Nocardiopsis terrae]GHC75749.1 metal-dependent phosphohydrolase [Nocardiopsis terrae]